MTCRIYRIGLSLVGVTVLRLVAYADDPGGADSASSKAASIAARPGDASPVATDDGDASAGTGFSAIPAIVRTPPAISEQPRGAGAGVDWRSVFRGAGNFLAVEQGFRLLTESKTRKGTRGSVLRNYSRSVRSLHGWADGDEMYVNYVGHPIQGSVAGFVWVGNDRSYRNAEFGRSDTYWKSRLRAAAFSWAYSTQFEIGPISEATVGSIQSRFPQQGFVDHVITPTFGMGWMVTEDAVDRYVVKSIEGATANRWIRLLARSGLNPTRTFANVLQGKAPWHRETRSGILQYEPPASGQAPALPAERSTPEISDTSGPAPFEFNATFQPERLSGGGMSLLCMGGGATAAVRISPVWQLVVDVGGCKMAGLETNVTGDSLTFMAGLRRFYGGSGRWTAHWQVLTGGHKVTEERMWPDRKKYLEAAALVAKSGPPAHADYTAQTESSGVAFATGCGVNYKLNRALALRVAELSYRHSWTAYQNGLKLASGLTLRMGTW